MKTKYNDENSHAILGKDIKDLVEQNGTCFVVIIGADKIRYGYQVWINPARSDHFIVVTINLKGGKALYISSKQPSKAAEYFGCFVEDKVLALPFGMFATVEGIENPIWPKSFVPGPEYMEVVLNERIFEKITSPNIYEYNGPSMDPRKTVMGIQTLKGMLYERFCKDLNGVSSEILSRGRYPVISFWLNDKSNLSFVVAEKFTDGLFRIVSITLNVKRALIVTPDILPSMHRCIVSQYNDGKAIKNPSVEVLDMIFNSEMIIALGLN